MFNFIPLFALLIYYLFLQLWLTLAEQHLARRSVPWSQVERSCFNEWSNPDDDELGDQIVKVSI